MGRIRNLNKTTSTTASDLDNDVKADSYIPVDNASDGTHANDTIALAKEQARTLFQKFESSLPDNTPVTNPLGNITTSTTVSDLKAKTASQIIQDLLFQTLPPTITTNKSLTLTGLSGTVEVGTTVSENLVATFNQGLITNGGNLNVGGSTTVALVGAITTDFVLTGFATGTQTPNTIPTGSTATFNSVGGVAALGNNTATVTISHSEGTGAYYNSEGESSTLFTVQRAAQAGLTGTATITGRYKIFYGTIAGGSQSGAEAIIDAYNETTRRLGSNQFETDTSIAFEMGASDYGFVLYVRTASSLTPEATDLNTNATLTLTSASVNVYDASLLTTVAYTEYRFTSAAPLEGDISITLS